MILSYRLLAASLRRRRRRRRAHRAPGLSPLHRRRRHAGGLRLSRSRDRRSGSPRYVAQVYSDDGSAHLAADLRRHRTHAAGRHTCAGRRRGHRAGARGARSRDGRPGAVRERRSAGHHGHARPRRRHRRGSSGDSHTARRGSAAVRHRRGQRRDGAARPRREAPPRNDGPGGARRKYRAAGAPMVDGECRHRRRRAACSVWRVRDC